MNEMILKTEDLKTLKTYLIEKEASEATIEKYLRCAARLISFLSGGSYKEGSRGMEAEPA